MRRNLRLWTSTAFVAAISCAACGGGIDATGTMGGAGPTGSTTQATTAPSGSGTGGTGGTGGGGPCAGAPTLEFGDTATGSLAMTGQQDRYLVTGKKGQVVMVDIDAQYLGDADYDPTYIDSVVTLFDADGTQLAQNNDPIEYATNDSRLYTILPADGDYCLRVAECWTVEPNPASACASPKDKTSTDYALYLHELIDDPGDSNTADAEAGDDAASGVTVEYAKNQQGKYISSSLWGTFRDGGDVDVFRFTLPADLTGEVPAGSRAAGYFHLMPSGPKESGSTAPTGAVTIVDPSAPGADPSATTPGAALAEVDATASSRLSPPLTVGKEYWLYVTRSKGQKGPNDFYFLRHYPGWGNPLEVEKGMAATNDTPVTAEPITITASGGFIEGDLATPQDVDHFLVTVPSGMTQVSVVCGAQHDGSGLRGLTLSLLATDGSAFAGGATAVEPANAYAHVSNLPLGGASQLVLKVGAASQDPSVAGTFYRCAVRFKP
jgi:hypothetical protein